MAAAALKMATLAACIAVVFLSMGPSAMADIQDDCRVICRQNCDGFSTDVCNTVIDIASILNTLNFFFPTCKVRVSGLCSALCVNICSLNTITPAPPAASPAPLPPCKPY
ncbi:hypothetical protein HU200_049106 [Digitaria exilis]|uniref:Uncharacterized protein n=1 Tax=Digitaria exilis TaxID=1010633 RepID=A0A835B0I1_9POAL|nr:hypothetical protein HU200_049106 [Digitaria exilis]